MKQITTWGHAKAVILTFECQNDEVAWPFLGGQFGTKLFLTLKILVLRLRLCLLSFSSK